MTTPSPPSLLTSTTTTTNTNRPVMMFYAIRGPLMIVSVLVAIVFPIITTDVLVKASLLALGCMLMTWDLFVLTKTHLQHSIRDLLNGIILDDVLRSIFDPEIGFIATSLGTFYGNMGMYTLPLNIQQRTELLQATLWVNEDSARTILTSPGGCRLLLPESFQKWLYGDDVLENNKENNSNEHNSHLSVTNSSPNNNNNKTPKERSNNDGDTDNSSCESDVPNNKDPKQQNAIPQSVSTETPTAIASRAIIVNGTTSTNATNNNEHEANNDRRVVDNATAGNSSGQLLSSTSSSTTTTQQSKIDKTRPATTTATTKQPTFEDPAVVFGKIIKDIVSEKFKRSIESIPQSTLQIAAMSTILTLCSHLYVSRRARKIALGIVESILLVGISGVAAGACTTLFAKTAIAPNDQNSNSSANIQQPFFDLIISTSSSINVKDVITKLKTLVSGKGRKWQGGVALLILMILGKKTMNKKYNNRLIPNTGARR